ncbi:putative methyltransferase-domain-containing protein [Catenaria anguillulae PL171]|uniref:Putative methyltransferase-domain-containing protein n=1 Tax=Catenaria anguillulae PL171 TaxID=765915 RepID=A0A1Y2I038_9FUNG|nr:putative methyltransferase-domain-containing protein [Catenaria anguillulae PL171]
MSTYYLPPDPAFTQVDPIHRVSLLKPPQTTAHGLVLSLALHNDLGTRIARNNLTVTVGWTFREGVPPGLYVLAGSTPGTNKWSQAGVAISQFDVSRIVVPIVQRGSASAPALRDGWKKGRGALADVAVDPLPLASLAISVSPTPLVAVSQLWQAGQELDWIMPLRIQFPTSLPGVDSHPVLSRPIRLARPDTPSSGNPPSSPMLWISEPSAFDHKPLGSSVWDAALVLAGHLTSSPSLVTASTVVVELGAGCGFLGKVLTAAHPTPLRTVLTDLPNVVEPYMRANTQALCSVTCAAYCWGDPWPNDLVAEQNAGEHGEHVVVVGADITYNEALYPKLLASLVQLRRKWPRAKVVVAFKRRSSEGEEEFLRRFDDQVVKRMNGGESGEWEMEVVARTAGQVYVMEAGLVARH